VPLCPIIREMPVRPPSRTETISRCMPLLAEEDSLVLRSHRHSARRTQRPNRVKTLSPSAGEHTHTLSARIERTGEAETVVVWVRSSFSVDRAQVAAGEANPGAEHRELAKTVQRDRRSSPAVRYASSNDTARKCSQREPIGNSSTPRFESGSERTLSLPIIREGSSET
jgi:hypothetical protein